MAIINISNAHMSKRDKIPPQQLLQHPHKHSPLWLSSRQQARKLLSTNLIINFSTLATSNCAASQCGTHSRSILYSINFHNAAMHFSSPFSTCFTFRWDRNMQTFTAGAHASRCDGGGGNSKCTCWCCCSSSSPAISLGKMACSSANIVTSTQNTGGRGSSGGIYLEWSLTKHRQPETRRRLTFSNN